MPKPSSGAKKKVLCTLDIHSNPQLIPSQCSSLGSPGGPNQSACRLIRQVRQKPLTIRGQVDLEKYLQDWKDFQRQYNIRKQLFQTCK